MATKGPDAFRTISEVARELDVPQHVLRFWESRFTQVRPMKRRGGRRHYRPEDIALLRGIHRLLYVDGFTIKGVQKILRERGVAHVAAAAEAGAEFTTAQPEHVAVAESRAVDRLELSQQVVHPPAVLRTHRAGFGGRLWRREMFSQRVQIGRVATFEAEPTSGITHVV